MKHLTKNTSELQIILDSERKELELLKKSIVPSSFPLDYSENRDDYIFKEEDKIRNTVNERMYLKQFRNLIFSSFDNKCAICRDTSNGIELDHFYVAKSQFGNFYLTHKLDYKINNAVPLCITCNRNKGAKPYGAIISDKRILTFIKLTNRGINRRINKF